MTTRHSLCILVVLAAAALACTSPLAAPTPTPEVLADCFLSFHAAAWEDLDGDGLRGASEPPLEGVEFRLMGMFAEILSEQPSLSDADGQASISTWTPGGCVDDYTITAVPPESYEPTTPISVTFADPGDKVWQFGFRAISK